MKLKTYLIIPVFLGMLTLTGQVAADEVAAANVAAASNTATTSATESSATSTTTSGAETVTAATNPVPPQGTYTFTETTGVKSEPKQSSPDLDFYQPGEQAHYDKTVENDDRLWISYNSHAGTRSYVAVRDLPDEPVVAAQPVVASTRTQPVVSEPTPEAQAAAALPASGTYTFTEKVPVKAEPKLSAPDRAYYEAGEKVNYDKKVEADNHLWLTYVNYSGGRSYVPVIKLDAAQPTRLSAPTAPAKLEVVDYQENKTDFTVKVTGAEQGKQISKVQVAVWSANKDQDDLKWYTPRITNNQAQVKVNIADHSNTSDDYIVHAYTTYTDKTTVFTNLGSYKIVRSEPKAAKLEVVDYAENKTNFTVKVTGAEQGKQISKVQVAVWSANKDQDDLKWYEPKIINNQASFKVDIANHSNTSDSYIVHAYTTYTDKTTVFTNLGAHKIVKPEAKPAKLEVVDYAANKTDFTVKVTGAEQGKQISKVQVAVWSAGKDQDDLKWYEPKIINNQASFKVDIANHSNTSDSYIVHAYTTYADKTTAFTNLGAYRIVKPEAKPAKLEVVDYQENKTDFTVKVTGAEQGKQISKVQVAVWSAGKDQDDLKWYEPKITNNQASFKVDIANHSNTSDSYIVHAYTTYADKTTAFTNLGAYRIVKPEAKPAKLEVVDYAENKTDFTVKVTGAEQGKQISKVQVAVWSAGKDQDDLKWYEPKIANNQASFKVDIANHSNTSDSYIVHAYTTYADKTTAFTNLGAYRIVKPEAKSAKLEIVDYAENKTDFTVKVTGAEQGKQISKVQVAVWSAGKDQDDLKWYMPRIVNNQASFKVNIADHSNTSDNYIVHAYTTYTDKTTVFTNLGAHKIVKPEAKPAKLEVVDYAENKTDFTVKVTGAEQGKQISKVQVAVWSANKDQDDLKWYTPRIVNNQASFKVNIADHSNTSDDYIVHAYTTYTDKTTVFTNLGSYKIVKPELKQADVQVIDYDENKSEFTVKVTGSEETKTISRVRVAVWSEDKGQDDLKWYEPKVANNQAQVTVSIGSHSNTVGTYRVHVYTTYTDTTTTGVDLGAYQINHPAEKGASASQGNYDILTRTIFLDAGHGGRDPGAVYFGQSEKSLNLSIQEALKERLIKAGYQVLLTRSSDNFVELLDRSKLVNDTLSDLFVSIHFNASPSSGANGIETYYYKYDPEYQPKINAEFHEHSERLSRSKFLAEAVQRETVANTGARNNGVLRETFSVLRETVAPAILLELGYLSNPSESAKVRQKSYQEKLVDGIFKGIQAYYNKFS